MINLRSMTDWDIYMGADGYEFAYDREQREARARQEAKQARIDRMRRVAPKGTYIPPKLLKAKRRVAAEPGKG